MINVTNKSARGYYIAGQILAPLATLEFDDSVANDIKGNADLEIVKPAKEEPVKEPQKGK